jgi:hypothetical protein
MHTKNVNQPVFTFTKKISNLSIDPYKYITMFLLTSCAHGIIPFDFLCTTPLLLHPGEFVL